MRFATLIEELREVGVVVLPPASADEIENLREACGGTLPDELGKLLAVTAGFEHPSLEWKPEPAEVGFVDAGTFLRASHHRNGDGFAVEPHGDSARVWWIGHDSWFIVYWASSITNFLAHWLVRLRRSEESERFVDLDRPLQESQPIYESADPEVSAFLASLPRGTFVHDLRNAQPGTQIPYPARTRMMKGGALHRQDLLFGFSPKPRSDMP